MLDFIPLPHVVTHTKSGELDDWGYTVPNSETSQKLRARVSYNTKNEVITLSSGKQITFKATMLLEGLPNVKYTDVLKWEDDFGRVHERNPVEVDYKKDMSGNPVAVKVVV